MESKFVKTVETQHVVQGDRVGGTELGMRGIGSGVKVGFVELHDAFRWIIGSHGSSFENLMIECDGSSLSDIPIASVISNSRPTKEVRARASLPTASIIDSSLALTLRTRKPPSSSR
jgi:hypothetical protein